MKVARQFTAWNRPKTRPSHRDGVMGLTPIYRLNDLFGKARKRPHAKERPAPRGDSFTPCATGRIFFADIPGSKLPGYL
ncbi:MAG TPA: hypothetical protein VK673_07810, partial [Chthoniobacterales bacterium]|nr:hypothetical protein [Chthoniobacterales bacterium]